MGATTRTVKVLGAVILAAYAVFAVGCSKHEFTVDPEHPPAGGGVEMAK